MERSGKNQEETIEKQLYMRESRKGQNRTINIQILTAVLHPAEEGYGGRKKPFITSTKNMTFLGMSLPGNGGDRDEENIKTV